MDKFDQLERLQWSSHSSPSKGPRRLCKFCFLAIIVPVILLILPLYIRYQALKPHIFTMSPSDMKLLNQESRVSTIWCDGQHLKMNSSFNAYLLAEKPKIQRLRHHITMHRQMMLEDDVKEYWGFYLLKGSSVSLSVCSRHEGAGFIIVKGLEDARRCAWLGELDSIEEDSDEISDEFEFSNEFFNDGEPIFPINDNNHTEDRSSNISATVSVEDDNLGQLTNLSKQELMQLYLAMLRKYGKTEMANEFRAFKLKENENLTETDDAVVSTTERIERDVDRMASVEEDYDVVDAGKEDDFLRNDKGREEMDVIYDLLDRGAFNQKTKNDKSNEEVRSSWSSSEEALAKCEGLIYNVPLNGGTRCTPDATSETLSNITSHVTLDVKETAFYYFIFANENEITDNFLSATFDLKKSVFDVSTNVQNCTNATNCDFPLSFWSKEHVVLEIPEDSEKDQKQCEALLGFSSLAECHKIVVAESVCKPRKIMYMGFLLAVPVMILVFANI